MEVSFSHKSEGGSVDTPNAMRGQDTRGCKKSTELNAGDNLDVGYLSVGTVDIWAG